MSGVADSPARRPHQVVDIRLARLRDLRALVHLYRHRSEQSKAYYHPFPFDPIRLSSVFLWLIATRRWVR
ncbi:MAG TPA: hypothetical protein VEY07_08695, partial [Thermoplasmata archaeon]|nr:hypothetical protein [Thermoplasmata archaeon]